MILATENCIAQRDCAEKLMHARTITHLTTLLPHDSGMNHLSF